MSLARAFTTRRQKQSSTDMGMPHRSNTTARGHANAGSIRNKISGPTELTHTTNMLAYNAPDLYPKAETSPTSSAKSDDESSDGLRSNASSPPTSPDMPSSQRSSSPEPNHLSCYFTAPGHKLPTKVPEVPSIPKRAPSHTKKASIDNLANKFARLSNQSSNTMSSAKSSLSLSRSSSTSTTATTLSTISHAQKSSIPNVPAIPTVLSPPATRPSFRRPAEHVEQQHPFGQELAKVSELAEELGLRDTLQIIDEEQQQLMAKGLYSFRPEDYLDEIQALQSMFFKQPPAPAPTQQVWI
ncbi:hypothetical protein F5Y15DRAFT_121332 [Xylariaceae sp. FL0016]|nr:hypothetical protein F5Y15DRAFT_121332 [Xylariaceae sp. FL0016]